MELCLHCPHRSVVAMESFLNRDFLILALKTTATVTCSIFVGAATYVNIVEVPARYSGTGVHWLVVKS